MLIIKRLFALLALAAVAAVAPTSAMAATTPVPDTVMITDQNSEVYTVSVDDGVFEFSFEEDWLNNDVDWYIDDESVAIVESVVTTVDGKLDASVNDLGHGKSTAKIVPVGEGTTSVRAWCGARLCAIKEVKVTKGVKPDLKNARISGVESSYSYQGSAVKPMPTVTLGGTLLKQGTDFVVTYSNNEGIGNASLLVRGINNYAGAQSIGFTIKASERYTVSFDSLGGSSVRSQTVESGGLVARPDNPTRAGYVFAGWYTGKSSGSAYDFKQPVTGNLTLYARWTKESQSSDSGSSDTGDANSGSKIPMHRLYNPNSGEHFYTANDGEKANLVSAGWNYEGIGWMAPAGSSTPVYRLYNKYGGEHHYTTSATEKDSLVKAGWKYEGIGWYSDDAKTVPLYRQYNPNALSCNHNYTTSKDENDWLVGLGWTYEGVGWYGV